MRIRQHIGSGQPVLFLHAALADGRAWRDVTSRAPHGFESFVADLPDHASDDPDATLESIERTARDFLRASRAMGSWIVVGHSFGAWLAGRLFFDPPADIERAVLIAGLQGLPEPMADAYEATAHAIERGEIAAADPHRNAIATGLGSSPPPHAAAELEALAGEWPSARVVRCMRRVAGLRDPATWVRPYDVPALVLHQEHDASCPLELGRELAALGTRAVFEIIPGDGHMLPMSHPDRVAAAVYAR